MRAHAHTRADAGGGWAVGLLKRDIWRAFHSQKKRGLAEFQKSGAEKIFPASQPATQNKNNTSPKNMGRKNQNSKAPEFFYLSVPPKAAIKAPQSPQIFFWCQYTTEPNKRSQQRPCGLWCCLLSALVCAKSGAKRKRSIREQKCPARLRASGGRGLTYMYVRGCAVRACLCVWV